MFYLSHTYLIVKYFWDVTEINHRFDFLNQWCNVVCIIIHSNIAQYNIVRVSVTVFMIWKLIVCEIYLKWSFSTLWFVHNYVSSRKKTSFSLGIARSWHDLVLRSVESYKWRNKTEWVIKNIEVWIRNRGYNNIFALELSPIRKEFNRKV